VKKRLMIVSKLCRLSKAPQKVLGFAVIHDVSPVLIVALY